MNKLHENIIEKSLKIISILVILTVLLIISFIIVESIPAIQKIGFIEFIFGSVWDPKHDIYGVLPMITSTLIMITISLIIAIPLSIGCAIFTTQYANNFMRKILKPTIQTLAGIPSVIYGFFGLVIIVPFIRENIGGSGFSLLSASIILAIMILPTIITISEDSLKAIPEDFYEISYALGATKLQTIRKAILPLALPSIITAIILGLGRAIGETMAVIMIAGNVAEYPTSVLSPVRSLTSNIALEMGYAIDLHYNALFMTGLILLVVIMILIAIAQYVQNKNKLEGM